jgi:hypothetical protein
MFNTFLNNFQIPIHVDKFEYEDTRDLCFRYRKLVRKNKKYKKIDILVINSRPRSGQYPYDRNNWNDFLKKLSKKYNIATTEFVEKDILCLADLNVKDIASLALTVKKIITIDTGPSIPLYNKHILDNVENIYMFGGMPKNTRKMLNYYGSIYDLSSVLL